MKYKDLGFKPVTFFLMWRPNPISTLPARGAFLKLFIFLLSWEPPLQRFPQDEQEHYKPTLSLQTQIRLLSVNIQEINRLNCTSKNVSSFWSSLLITLRSKTLGVKVEIICKCAPHVVPTGWHVISAETDADFPGLILVKSKDRGAIKKGGRRGRRDDRSTSNRTRSYREGDAEASCWDRSAWDLHKGRGDKTERRDKEQKLKDVKMKTKVREKVKRIPGQVLVLYDAVLPGSTQGTPTPGTSRDNGASCCCINALFYKWLNDAFEQEKK